MPDRNVGVGGGVVCECWHRGLCVTVCVGGLCVNVGTGGCV